MTNASRIELTPSALDNLAETGTSHAADLAALQDGHATTATIGATCIDGADDDRLQGWHEYLNALAEANQHGKLAVAVEGGFLVFRTTTDRDIWLAQV